MFYRIFQINNFTKCACNNPPIPEVIVNGEVPYVNYAIYIMPDENDFDINDFPGKMENKIKIILDSFGKNVKNVKHVYAQTYFISEIRFNPDTSMLKTLASTPMEYKSLDGNVDELAHISMGNIISLAADIPPFIVGNDIWEMPDDISRKIFFQFLKSGVLYVDIRLSALPILNYAIDDCPMQNFLGLMSASGFRDVVEQRFNDDDCVNAFKIAHFMRETHLTKQENLELTATGKRVGFIKI